MFHLHTHKFALLAIFASVISAVLAPSTSFAEAPDYRFEVLSQPIKATHEATFAVRITKIATATPLTNATISQEKLHMIMGNMDMPVAVKLLPPDSDGNYHFSADLSMYGEWTLDLVATASNEKSPLTTTVKFQVIK